MTFQLSEALMTFTNALKAAALPSALLLICAFSTNTALAKDLRNRVGVGFTTDAGIAPALGVRYVLPSGDPAINIQGEVLFGKSSAGSGARLHYGIVAEDNMNLSAVTGVVMTWENGGQVLRLQPGLNADFFLFGLDNLSLTTGWGIDLGAELTTWGTVLGGANYWF